MLAGCIWPAGGKLWRLKYRISGKEKGLSFGADPDVSLKAARECRDEARKLAVWPRLRAQAASRFRIRMIVCRLILNAFARAVTDSPSVIRSRPR